MRGRVIVIGSVNVDFVVTVNRLPAPGETVTGGRYDRYDGGKGGNQAVAAARLGVRTAFVGAVGADELGAQARAALEREGVDVQGLETIDGVATGVALIVVGRDGENQIAVASGANAVLTPAGATAALERLAPRRGDVVLVGHEIPTPVVRAALREARAAGATVVLNPAPAAGLDRSTFALADLITPNRGELATLAATESVRLGGSQRVPDDPARAAATLVERNAEGDGVDAVLVSLGMAGAVLVRAGTAPAPIPAPPVEATDTTGAGDALNGALAAGLAAGLALEMAAERAVRAATLSTLRPGARAGLPTRDELDGPPGQWPPTLPAQAENA